MVAVSERAARSAVHAPARPAVHASHSRSLSFLPWAAAALPFGFVLLRGFPAGDDWQLELARVASYLQAWTDGQAPPFWAPNLYGGYGSPIFLFYGQVFLAAASLWAWVTGSTAHGFTLGLALASAAAVWALQRTASALDTRPSDRAAGRIAAYAFLLSPYLLADLLLRSAAAEYTALCLMPLALYGLASRDRRTGVVLLSIGSALIVATHTLMALASSTLMLPLALHTRKHPSQLRRVAVAAGFAVALSAFAWLPVLSYKSLIRTGDLLAGKFSYRLQFQSFADLFDFGNRYGAGPLPLVAALAGVLAALRARRAGERSPLPALLIAFCALVIVQTSLALPLWELLPGLPYFQFPWRFNGPLALASALLAGLAFARLTRGRSERVRIQLELLVLGICVCGALPQLGRTRAVDPVELSRFEKVIEADSMQHMLFTSTVGDEYLPAQAHRNVVRRPASEDLVVDATAGLSIAIRHVEPRALAFDVRTPPHLSEAGAEICLARWAFPFWSVRVDDRPQPVSACAGGRLRAQLPEGKHHVEVTLPMPAARWWGLVLSGLALVALLGWMHVTRKRYREPAA